MSQSSEDNLHGECGSIVPARTSEVFKKLRINPIKALYKYYTPHNINLAGGIPLESCFPFKSMQVNLDGEDESDGYTLTKGDDLYLNYHMSDGIVPLKNWAKGHVQSIHSPPFSHEVTLTIGATDSWYKIIELLSTECVLFDQYVYGASVTPCNTHGKKSIGVPSDDQGIIPSALRETVRVARAQGLVVDVLYLIPVGHNPMGVTMPIERKKEIYAACQELDLIIVEDGVWLCFL
jgi:DNA-binding transcriptional MocR family regulator